MPKTQPLADPSIEMTLAPKGVGKVLQELRQENAYLKQLISWIAPRIERRNANGAVADKFCILCVLGQPQYKRLPCRHSELWAIAKGETGG